MADEVCGGVDVERLRRHVDAFRIRHGIPAIAVRVRRASAPVFDYDCGFACLERRVRAGPQTLYAIGSITKQFVAATALELHRRRWLDLLMPVRDMLASSRVGEHITLFHLLSHTSGIVYDVGTAAAPSPTLASVLERAATDARPPGSHWFYCNTNYFLAAHALQVVTGVPLSELVQEVIPDDVKAFFRLEGAPHSFCCAAGHTLTPDGVGTVAPPDGRSFGSGSAYATATMLATWANRLWSGDILSAESAKLMARRTVLSDGMETDYGLGCFSTRSSIAELSHDGNSAGFSAQLAYYPDSKLVICVLTNSEQHVAEELEKSLRDIVLGTSVSPRPRAAADLQSPLANLAGCYGVGNRSTNVTIKDEGLRLVAPSGRVVHLVRQHDDMFVEHPFNGYEYHFGLSRDGYTLQIRRGQKLLVELSRRRASEYGNDDDVNQQSARMPVGRRT